MGSKDFRNRRNKKRARTQNLRVCWLSGNREAAENAGIGALKIGRWAEFG